MTVPRPRGVTLLGVAVLATAVQAAPSPTPPATPRAMVGPPLALQVVTDRDNGKTFTLTPDTTLVVRLRANPTTGSDWNLLLPPHLPLTLSGPPRYTPDRTAPGVAGAGGVDEFDLAPQYQPGVTQACYLRLLRLAPFRPGVAGAPLFEIRVILPPQWTPPPLPLSDLSPVVRPEK